MQRAARISFVLSLLLLALVTLDFVKLFAGKVSHTTKRNISVIEAVDKIGQVLSENSNPAYKYIFNLKDSSAQNIVNNGEKNSGAISEASITVLNQSSFHCGEGGKTFTWTELFGSYKIVCQEGGTMQIRISKSGYISRTVNLPHYTGGDITTIYLTKYVLPPTSEETIRDVVLPAVFKGKETTDLSKIVDPSKVEDLTFDSENNKIKFREVIDLSSKDIKDKFKILDQFVDFTKVGIVSLDSVNLPVLNKKASIEMKNLSFIKTPKVLVDGKEDESVVSSIRYENGVLTFNTNRFSTFMVAPEVEITQPLNGFETDDKTISLKGIVSDTTATVSAKLNNKDLGNMKVATSSGEFSRQIDLELGLNKIVVEAISKNGAITVASISGTLIVAASRSNLLVYLVLFALALVAGFGIVYSVKKIKASKINPQQKLNF